MSAGQKRTLGTYLKHRNRCLDLNTYLVSLWLSDMRRILLYNPTFKNDLVKSVENRTKRNFLLKVFGALIFSAVIYSSQTVPRVWQP